MMWLSCTLDGCAKLVGCAARLYTPLAYKLRYALNACGRTDGYKESSFLLAQIRYKS
jgi:hypothetical protein